MKPQTTASGSAMPAGPGDIPKAEEPDERRPDSRERTTNSEDQRESPTGLPGIPGHGMTSNMPEDAD